MKSILQIILILSISLTACGKEYHVDGNVSKPGDGSANKPFKTIAQAAKVMQKGDVCYIHAGTYRENLITKSSGTDSKPITFRPFNNDVVIISATEKVEGWELYKDNIYLKRGVEMNLGAGNNVFFNGQKMQLARWPNRTGSDPYELDARYINQEKGTWSMSFISNDEIQDIDWTGGIIHYLGAHSGCSWERTITGYDRDLHRVHFATLPDQWPFGSTHSPFRFENGHRGIFFLMNKLEALDAPNEWYYDAREKVLYVCTPDGTSPNDAHIEITARTNSAEIKNDFIRFENLNFFGGMVTITGSNNQLARCMVKHGSDRLVTDLKGAAMNDAAIQILGGDQNLIEKCVLESGTLNGIYLDSRAEDNLVQNNIIQYFNTIGIHAGLVNSGGAGNKFLRNSLYGSARDGVKVYGDNSEFGYNHVQKCLITGASYNFV